MSNDCPDLYAGASGSPLFDAVSGDIIGVIGTGTLLNFEEGPDFDCQINRPCVMDAGGPLTEQMHLICRDPAARSILDTNSG